MSTTIAEKTEIFMERIPKHELCKERSPNGVTEMCLYSTLQSLVNSSSILQ